jgi:DMSO reductase family type II enzyme heme b subunit
MHGLLLALLLSAIAAPVWAQDAPPPALAMARIAGHGPVLDADAFATAAALPVAMLPQVIATPRQAAPSVGAIEVRAVRNDDHAGFLIAWDDATADWRTSVDGFGDMVALQLPIAAESGAIPFMGNPGGRVNILQWRADWQSDLERGPLAVKDLYPNAYAADFHHEDHLPESSAAAFRAAAGVGNPMAERKRTSAVQDLMAEGFGSLTPRAAQAGQGLGRHDGKRWQVAITRPLAPQGESAASLEPGSKTQIAFAVWNGAAGEVGARKAWAMWVPLEVPR